jgi:hypothetical protein
MTQFWRKCDTIASVLTAEILPLFVQIVKMLASMNKYFLFYLKCINTDRSAHTHLENISLYIFTCFYVFLEWSLFLFYDVAVLASVRFFKVKTHSHKWTRNNIEKWRHIQKVETIRIVFAGRISGKKVLIFEFFFVTVFAELAHF